MIQMNGSLENCVKINQTFIDQVILYKRKYDNDKQKINKKCRNEKKDDRTSGLYQNSKNSNIKHKDVVRLPSKQL